MIRMRSATFATLAWFLVVSPVSAHIPSQCAEWVQGSEMLRFELLSMFEARKDKTALHDDARRTLDHALELAEGNAYETKVRDAEEWSRALLRLWEATNEAAIAYETVASSMLVELEQYLEWSAKATLVNAALRKCIQESS